MDPWFDILLVTAAALVVLLLLWAVFGRGRELEVKTSFASLKLGGEPARRENTPPAPGAALIDQPVASRPDLSLDSITGPEIRWEQVIAAIRKVTPQIRAYDPEVIVGLADGMVVAAIIAVNIPHGKSTSFRPYHALGVKVSDDGPHGTREIKFLGDEGLPDMKGKKVLLVDDHLYTGSTLAHAVRFLRERGVGDLRTLVLFESSLQKKMVIPDISAFKMEGGRKKVPWTYTDEHFQVYET